MSKARTIGIAAGAAAVILGAGITAANNNSNRSPAITVEINSESPASSPILPTETTPAEPEEAVSVPEKEAEILAVTVEPKKTTPAQTTTAATHSPAADTTTEKPPETASTSSAVTTRVTTTATTEPDLAAVTIPEKHSQTVYIAASGKGSKYHSKPDCSNMKGANAISIDDAKAQGYTACKKCY